MADAVTVEMFMSALSNVESSWTPQKERAEDWSPYAAVNPTSGATGRFQFMPAVAIELAQRHLGTAIARDDVPMFFDGATIEGRQRQNVAALKELRRLYRTYHDWRRVAGYWRSGFRGVAQKPSELTDGDRRYISEVMARLGFPPVPDSTVKYVPGRYWYEPEPCPECPPVGVPEDVVAEREAQAKAAGYADGLLAAERAIRAVAR